MLIDLLFVTPENCFAEQTISEIETRQEWLNRRIRATAKFQQGVLNGSLSAGDFEEFFDLLAEEEVEPTDYLEAIIENINHVIDNQIALYE